MSEKPILLDAFCGAGGTTKGYQRAGFYVVGVDHKPQPNYCGDNFIQGDALVHLEAIAENNHIPLLDAIHASPPCQAYTAMNQRWAESRAANPALIDKTRELLDETGLPYVIENVTGAIRYMQNAYRLCGRAFGLPVHRHRLFESNVPLMAHPCPGGPPDPFGVYGKLDGRRLWTRVDGSELRAPRTVEEAGKAMGIDWMTWDELREAVPPAMTEHIGSYLMTRLKAPQPLPPVS